MVFGLVLLLWLLVQFWLLYNYMLAPLISLGVSFAGLLAFGFAVELLIGFVIPVDVYDVFYYFLSKLFVFRWVLPMATVFQVLQLYVNFALTVFLYKLIVKIYGVVSGSGWGIGTTSVSMTSGINAKGKRYGSQTTSSHKPK